MDASEQFAAHDPASRRTSPAFIAIRVLKQIGFLLVAVACLAAYEHFSADGQSTAAIVSVVAAAGFGFAPLRELIRIVFGIEGKMLHIAHAVGGLALISLPLGGVVPGAPMLTHAALAPFAIMGAAQAMMHSNHPRNAQQAAALQGFAATLPEVAQFTNPNSLASPANAARAVTVLSDILSKAQALGETELNADPGFQSAMSRVSTRFGANLGLDAVNLALTRMAANPATARAVPKLRQQLTAARQSIAGTRPR
ncbi:MAG: hypothetical protein ABI311_07245 [Gemmatimonadaceae bacterium]